MLNNLLTVNGSVSDVESMLRGHVNYLNKNTGVTNDGKLDHYVLNPECVLSNNRHFLFETQMEAPPNGGGTTEGQSVLILGYCYAYLATGEQEYLDLAEKAFDGYHLCFYHNQPIPTTPQRWQCNWFANAKEPILSNWPINFKEPTHSGFKGIMMNFVNGRTQIPHGAPYWGEYLDKATYAFDGALGWDSMVATVYGLQEDGIHTDWNKAGVKYEIEWLINYLGKKISGTTLRIIDEGYPPEQYGTVQLRDTNVQGMHKFNWANAQPLDKGGYLIGRNDVMHNRPLRVPVAVNPNTGVIDNFGTMGNAADAEEWFMDSCYVLYKITNKTKYLYAYRASRFTNAEYKDIDSRDKFFRQEVGANSPFTDGISYQWIYPSGTPINYQRDAEGYIDVTVGGGAQHSLEQQAVWFKVDGESTIRTTVSGRDGNGDDLTFKVVVALANDKNDPKGAWTRWQSILPFANGSVPSSINVKLKDFTQIEKADGRKFVTADQKPIAVYGGAVNNNYYEDNIYDGRSAQVNRTTLSNTAQGLIIGFWLQPDRQDNPQSIVYRSNVQTHIKVTDDDNWRWHWVAPSTTNTWSRKMLNKSELILNSYQPNEDRPANAGNGWYPPRRPTYPNYQAVKQIEIIEETTNPSGEFSWYCVNDVPGKYNEGAKFTKLYTLTTVGSVGFNYKLGDCTVIDYLPGNLFCTPGVIPFSNINQPDTESFNGWHGLPYPGYQYPFIFHEDGDEVELNNMTEFLYQSQVWYSSQFGILGPGASAYIWNRWDNYTYGPPDTWTMYHWGNKNAWSGYQARAFFGAARCWYELVKNGRPVPEKLIKYTENWMNYLWEFHKTSNGKSPVDFPATSVPVPTGYNGHMVGLYLAGCSCAAMAGTKFEWVNELMEKLVGEIQFNYKITGVPNHVMDGSWSPAVRLETGSGPENNGMFYGFWAGEIMRGLGLYLMCKRGIKAPDGISD